MLPTALRLAASWSWTVANCALPIVPLLDLSWIETVAFVFGTIPVSDRFDFSRAGYSAL